MAFPCFFKGFLPGLLLGYALKWFVERSNKACAASAQVEEEEAVSPSTRRLHQRRPASGEEFKMVLVVNDSLKMGKGKIGAQCAHAAVGVIEEVWGEDDEAVELWEESGQAKVCLKAKDEEELRALVSAAEEVGLPTYQVQDQGRTQVAPGSHTVLAIGPGPRSSIDKITGHLKLL